MPYAATKDNVKLYYEEAGSGTPILFGHEFAGDHRNWEPQMRFFSRRHRCITYSARGYKPSDVPRRREGLYLQALGQRRGRDPRPSQDRQGAFRRPVDGRLHRGACSASIIPTAFCR